MQESAEISAGSLDLLIAAVAIHHNFKSSSLSTGIFRISPVLASFASGTASSLLESFLNTLRIWLKEKSQCGFCYNEKKIHH